MSYNLLHGGRDGGSDKRWRTHAAPDHLPVVVDIDPALLAPREAA